MSETSERQKQLKIYNPHFHPLSRRRRGPRELWKLRAGVWGGKIAIAKMQMQKYSTHISKPRAEQKLLEPQKPRGNQ